MKVLIVHNILWAHYKAAVFQALHARSASANVQIKVLQIARNERSRAGWETTAAHAPVYRYDYELLFDRFVEEVSVGERTRALLSRMRQFRPDVLYLTGYYDPAQLALLAYAKLTGVPVVMQMESTAADHGRGGPKEALKRAILRLCDGFFCFGSLQAEYLMQLGVTARKILLRKTAVDNDVLLRVFNEICPNRSAKLTQMGLPSRNFVFVGRLIEPKNLPALLNAFAQARRQVDDRSWGLVFLGDGPLQAALEQQAQNLGITGQVRFLPAAPWYEVPQTLALADVLVLPSRSEPWGLVVNEAMVCGMPVLVSNRCGCVGDLVRDGENGFLFDPDQSDQLTGLMVKLMQLSDADRARMGAISEEMIKPWSVGAVADEMLAGFLRLGH
ncbi:glycosyltransferase [Rudanella lutea]|uniref:glycosyltransferase n=1 Tax=Rudanella lutea TaxID=451374 RepID=UPI000369D527|nr:glycosyltransferase [Rudanella lutea]